MPSFALVLGVATCSLLTGCGVKGPLYMPGYPTGSGTQPTTVPAGDETLAPESTLPEAETPLTSPVSQ